MATHYVLVIRHTESEKFEHHFAKHEAVHTTQIERARWHGNDIVFQGTFAYDDTDRVDQIYYEKRRKTEEYVEIANRTGIFDTKELGRLLAS